MDLNRACTPLLEIVSEPDIRSADEAVAYLKKLHQIVVYLGICDGNMEEGSFRCDANVSRHAGRIGTSAPGPRPRTSTPSASSSRPSSTKSSGRSTSSRKAARLIQETRLFDPATGTTRSMRGKEEAHDYRYFPDPDLVPLVIADDWVEDSAAPCRNCRMQNGSAMSTNWVFPNTMPRCLTASRELAEYFEACVALYPQAKPVANWVMGELSRALKEDNRAIGDCPVTPRLLAELLQLIEKGTISGKIAKTVFDEMYKTGKKPAAIVEEKGLVQVSDTGDIEKIIDEILAANPGQVEDYRGGKEKLFGFFVGQVMKASKGKANPSVVNELLLKKLKG